MDTPVLVAIISTVGVVLAAVVTFAGVRYTQRSSRAAAEATARLEAKKVDAAAYEAARDTWEQERLWLREQVTDLRGRVDELEHGRAQDRARIRELEEREARDRALIAELAGYARALLRILAEHHIPYPPPPPGLDSAGGTPR